MKPKTDTKKQPPPPHSSRALSRRRLKAFMDLLKGKPELLEQFESILQIASDGQPDAPMRTADEVESRVIEATRKLGNSTMSQWALSAQVRAVERCKKEHPKARIKKKSH
jgi:hypothetical protein